MADKQSSLVDYLGRPINLPTLKERVAAPTLGGVRTIYGSNRASGLTPARLASILRSAETGDPLAYFELAEQMEEKDLHYVSVLGTRKRQVVQLEITVEAASDDADDQANADLVRDWLDRDTLEEDLFDIMDAVGKGLSVTEIIWELSERQWWPRQLEWVDPRFLRADQLTGAEILLRDETVWGSPLQPFKYICHRIKAKSGLTVRGGLARPVSWAWMFKNFMVKDWMAFAEIYGMPLRIGKYDAAATPEDREALLRAVSDISTDAAAIIPRSMEVDFQEAGGSAGGEGMFERGADWFDRQVSKAVLGQTSSADSQKGSGYAQAKVQDGVREDIEQADAKALAGSLNRDLVRPLIDLNRGPPKSGKYPKLAIGRAESWDAIKMMPAVQTFVDMGGRVQASVIQDRLGLPDAGEGADVVLLRPVQTAVAAPVESPPGPGLRPGVAVTPAEMRAAATTAFSKLLMGPSGAGGTPAGGASDAIDHLVGNMAGDWEVVMNPLVAPVSELLAQCSTLEEFRDRLPEALAKMDSGALGDLLLRGAFVAQLAGLAGDLVSKEG